MVFTKEKKKKKTTKNNQNGWRQRKCMNKQDADSNKTKIPTTTRACITYYVECIYIIHQNEIHSLPLAQMLKAMRWAFRFLHSIESAVEALIDIEKMNVYDDSGRKK